MSEFDQLVKILKAITSQQKVNTLTISQLTASIESLATQMEEDKHQQKVYTHSDQDLP